MAVEIGVHPTRLDWDNGDIYPSYSADKIAENKGAIRPPFEFRGAQWVCVGACGSGLTGIVIASAYRLISPAAFQGELTTYRDISRRCSESYCEGCEHLNPRDQPGGFYHGLTVIVQGKQLVLCGPQVNFIPDASQPPMPPKLEQLGLFGAAEPDQPEEDDLEDDFEGEECDGPECDLDDGIPDLDESPICPECGAGTQFGEVCTACRRERQEEIESE